MNKKLNKVTLQLDKKLLLKLKDDEYACVELIKCIHHMSLHPFHLTEIGNSIKEILNEGITKYNHKLNGILLGYQNIKVIGSEAPINYDSCFIHMNIQVEFFIFKPALGKILNGIVTKKSHDHVGCLVHEIFNISLPKPHGSESWMGDKAQIGQEIQFSITFMQLEDRLPYFKAEFISILSEDSGVSTSDESPTKLKNTKIVFDEYDGEITTPKVSKKSKKRKLSDSLDVDTPKKKHKSKNCDDNNKAIKSKKHKKKKFNDDEEEISELKQKYKESLQDLANCVNKVEINDLVNELGPKKSKKKHKSKEIDAPKKKSKKHKHKKDDLDVSLPELNLDLLFNENISTSKSKKYKDSTSHDISWSERTIELPPDSDLEEILASKSKKNKAKKRSASFSDDNQIDEIIIKKSKKRKH